MTETGYIVISNFEFLSNYKPWAGDKRKNCPSRWKLGFITKNFQKPEVSSLIGIN